jgi:hypothetical protein
VHFLSRFLEFGQIKTYDFINSWMNETIVARAGSVKQERKYLKNYPLNRINNYDECGGAG